MTLTVLTWLWAQPGGRTAYTAEHVNIWADMVRRHLSIPHRLACVTDMPQGIDSRIDIIAPPGDFADVVLPTWNGDKPQCLRRLSMFRADAGEIFGQRFVCMDVDCVVSANLDSLFTRPEDIVLYASPGAGFMAQPRPYNGSMLMMTAGARPQVHARFTVAEAQAAGRRYVGSDQAWISHVLGDGEATWDERHGVVWWGRWKEGRVGRLVFFPGDPKPWDLVESHPWAALHYHRNRGGRCLVLGHGPGVWTDLEAALGRAPFAHVIAAPGVARHWPGEVSIAGSDAEADRMAEALGFDEIIVCGRSEGEAA